VTRSTQAVLEIWRSGMTVELGDGSAGIREYDTTAAEAAYLDRLRAMQIQAFHG
jgi:hypothetical protein